MASLRVQGFDHEGRPLQFDTWLDDLQLYLVSDSRDSVLLFDHTSGAAPAPPATADSVTHSQWLTRDAAARLAIRNHLSLAECAHFGQHKTAQALYDAVVARYSSPANAALGHLLLPYLFPELSAFAIVEDLVSHLRTSDARYCTAAPAEGAEPTGAGTGGAELGVSVSEGAEPGGVEPGGAESGGPPSVPSRREPLSPQQLREWYARRCRGASGGAGGAAGAGVAGGTGAVGGPAGVGAAGGAGAAGLGGAGTGGTGAGGASGAAGVGAAGAGAVATGGASGAGVAGGTRAGGAAGVVAGDSRAEGTGAVSAFSGAAARPPPPVQSQSQLQPASPLPGPPYFGLTRGLTERREPQSRPASPESRSESPVHTVRAGRCVSRPRPPPVPGTHSMTLRPSTASHRVPLPSPPAPSLPDGPDPESDSLCAASPTLTRFLATAVTDPLFESTAASALVAELVEFAAACRLDYATSLVAESASASVCPPNVGGECALSTDVLEDKQEEFECFSAALPHLLSMLLAPEGDPDAPNIPTPRSYAEAIEVPYSSQWQAAMDAEMAPWKSTSTYIDEVPLPGANIVSGMWIFRVKRPLGSLPVFKARYVARGFSQRQGVDFFQTFSPTPKMTTLRVLLHVTALRDYKLHSLDFSTAFLQGSLHKEIWLRRPPGFTASFPAGTQWSLRRPVYGLHQAPRVWHDTQRTTLAALVFAPSTADPSLFLHTDTTLPPFYVLVYIDDLVFATADTEALAHVKSELQKRHTCTDVGELISYLGLRITWDRVQRTITLTQSHMVQRVLQRFSFTYSLPQSTPLPTSHSLSAPPSDESVEPSGLYPELVCCLMYLMTCTRPDLAYPLSLLACYVAPGRHRKMHWDAAKRVLRYLCSTSGIGLVLGGRARVVPTGHADASWVDELATQRSSQGYTFSLGSGSVSWRSTRSSSVLSSSCEAEIYAGAMAAHELRWLTYLLTDLGDSGASRCFFHDSTTLTPLSAPVPITLADPSGVPLLARSSTVLPCPAVLLGSLSGLHLPSFSAKLVSNAALQDAMVTTTTLGGQRVSIHTCTRTSRHLATFNRRPGLSLYTLSTEPPQTLLWHHCLGYPSLPRLGGMQSRLLVSGLPRSLAVLLPSPALPCLPCVEGRQRAAPHSSSIPPTNAPLQTLHMDVWGPACVSGQGRERYFLLVVDDYTRNTTVFPLRSNGEVPHVLIPWIRAVRLQLCEWFRHDLCVLRLHSDRGGEFSSDLLRDFCCGEGILQSFMLPASPQQNGIAERRIGLVMEVARTSMIHAAAPHFLWPFAVWYAAHQLNLWPRVSLPETSPTLRWTGKVGDASVFRVWGSRAFVRDTSVDKLSARAIPWVFLGFPSNAPGWQFYHPTLRRVLPSQDVTFDESVPFYRLFPYRSAPPPPPPLFLAPSPPPVDPLLPQSLAPSGAAYGGAASRGAEPGGAEPGGGEFESAGSGGAEPTGAEPTGVESGGAEPKGAESEGVESGGAELRGAEPTGVEPGVAEPEGAESEGAESGGAEPRGTASLGVLRRTRLRSGDGGAGDSAAGDAGDGGVLATRLGGAGATAEAGGTGAGGSGAGDPAESGGAGTGGTSAGGARVEGAEARDTGAVGTGAGGVGAVDPEARGGTGVGGTVRPRPYFVPLLHQVLSLPSSTALPPSLLSPPPLLSQPQLQPRSPLRAPSPYTEQIGGLIERREPKSRPASPVRAVRTGRRISRPRPPPVPDTHTMALRPSSVPLHVPLPPPPGSSLPAVPGPKSDLARAATPIVSHLLATVVTGPSFESTAAFALVSKLVDFATVCRLDYATALVVEFESACPLSIGSECVLGTDVLEDRHEDFECLAAAVPRFSSMLLAPEGDPDALDIPTSRSSEEAITGPYSSQWQTPMDAEMDAECSSCAAMAPA
ncbi:unnamed protein product [Closterium sp. NIES-53]